MWNFIKYRSFWDYFIVVGQQLEKFVRSNFFKYSGVIGLSSHIQLAVESFHFQSLFLGFGFRISSQLFKTVDQTWLDLCMQYSFGRGSSQSKPIAPLASRFFFSILIPFFSTPVCPFKHLNLKLEISLILTENIFFGIGRGKKTSVVPPMKKFKN